LQPSRASSPESRQKFIDTLSPRLPHRLIHPASGGQRWFDEPQDHIHRRQRTRCLSKRLARQALQQVAQHGASSQSLGDDQAKPCATWRTCFLGFILFETQFEATTTQSQGTGHNSGKFIRPMQAFVGTKAAGTFRKPGHGRAAILDVA
jgi:hypothetical protein